jgi:hypothetical protein
MDGGVCARVPVIGGHVLLQANPLSGYGVRTKPPGGGRYA